MGESDSRLIRSPEDAEQAAADWLRHWGYADARVTGRGADGGVDVESATVVAQVKAEMKPVGRPVVQQIFGVAAHRNVAAVVFSLSGYTVEAESWALEASVALFEFDLQGEPQPVNVTAEALIDQAFSRLATDRLSALSEELGVELDVPNAEAAIEQGDMAGEMADVLADFSDAIVVEVGAAEFARDMKTVSGDYDIAHVRSWLATWMETRRSASDLFDVAKRCEEVGLQPFMLDARSLIGYLLLYLFECKLIDLSEDVYDDGLVGFFEHRVGIGTEGQVSVEATFEDDEDLAFVQRSVSYLEGLSD